MRLKIAFFIWLTGLAIFAIVCAVTLIGILIFPYVIGVSLVAIPVYAISLWLIKQAGISHKPAMGLLLTLSTTWSVNPALYFYKFYHNSREDWDLNGLEFWIPLLCCVLAVSFSHKSIKSYLHGETAIAEMITE